MISEMRPLTSSILVIGIKTFNPGRSIIISPGNRPRGTLLSQGQKTPVRMIAMPRKIKTFCIDRVFSMEINHTAATITLSQFRNKPPYYGETFFTPTYFVGYLERHSS